jgi:hypothetical protein
MRESLRIVAVCTLAAVGYGILHDLVTAHVCVEYFTEWHPQMVSSRNPVVLALVWGVVATWWVGALLGVLLAVVARVRLPMCWESRAPLRLRWGWQGTGACVRGARRRLYRLPTP